MAYTVDKPNLIKFSLNPHDGGKKRKKSQFKTAKMSTYGSKVLLLSVKHVEVTLAT